MALSLSFRRMPILTYVKHLSIIHTRAHNPFQRIPHAYTSPSSPDSARCWVPCIDNPWEKCTWEFEFVVPRYLEEREVTQDEEEQSDAYPTLVIASGDLIEQVSLRIY
jgi:hypothetical protein